MNKKIVILGAVLGLLSVIIGAFAAHGLKPLISVGAMQSFETGVRYQMYHALFLLFLGSTSMVSHKAKSKLFYLVLIGVILFSGSIYGLATNVLTGFDFKVIGFITPIGGVLLIAAWVVLLVNCIKCKND